MPTRICSEEGEIQEILSLSDSQEEQEDEDDEPRLLSPDVKSDVDTRPNSALSVKDWLIECKPPYQVHDEDDSDEEQSSPNEIDNGNGRPLRNRRLPTQLLDYVVGFRQHQLGYKPPNPPMVSIEIHDKPINQLSRQIEDAARDEQPTLETAAINQNCLFVIASRTTWTSDINSI